MDKKKDVLALNAPRTCGNIYYRKMMNLMAFLKVTSKK